MKVRQLSWVLALIGTTACSDRSPASSNEMHREPARIAFAVPGRSNSAPAVAGWGKMVAVSWTASTDALADIYVSVSEDGGATFRALVRVNDVEGDARASGEQAARVLIGPGNVIHVIWPSRRDEQTVIRYATSTDRGKSFSKATTVAGGKTGGMRGWQSAALGHDGAMHAIWLDGRNAASSGQHTGPNPGGRRHAHSAAGAPRQDLFHAAWKGQAPETDRLVAERVCFCCKTAVATSGDRVYVAWRHIFPGSIRDIAVARFTDNGATFGAPVRLSDDGWKIDACPDDGPSMSADAHGGIHIAWPTMVAGDAPGKGIFYASLGEGGTFTPGVRLDAGDADPAHPQIGADEHGTSAVVWDERAGNARRIVLRRVTSGVAEPPEIFEAAGANYPVVAAAQGYFVVVWSTQTPGQLPAIEGRQLPFRSH
jgi:hypothetical protein